MSVLITLKARTLSATWLVRRRWRAGLAYCRYLKRCIQGEAHFCRTVSRDQCLTLGTGDGAWTISRSALPENPVVLSFGVGNDISFDRAMIEQFQAIVHAYDPTPLSMNWISQQETPKGFHFHAVGISSQSGNSRFVLPPGHRVSFCVVDDESETAVECPVETWDRILSGLGITSVDVLKIDIEGAEYGIIDQILVSDVHVDQLLIEFHHRMHSEGIAATTRVLKRIYANGYRLFHVSHRGLEYSFVKADHPTVTKRES